MKIYEKLMNIQSELKANKGQFNKFGNYAYRSAEDILEALKPLLAKNKTVLTISDEINLIGDRYYIKATATLIDIETGETTTTTALAREEENKKGQDSSQTTGSTSSYARKYALNGLFCIDDTKDSDSTNKHGKDETKANETPKDNTNSYTITAGQVKRLFAIAASKNISIEQVKKGIIRDYNKTKAEDLTKVEYDDLIKKLETTKV